MTSKPLTPSEVFRPRGEPRELRTGHEDVESFELRRRPNGDSEVLVTWLDGKKEDLAQDLVVHSPTGFAWGYGGSGPGDLALNILARFLTPPVAWDLHQDFKWDLLANLPEQGATLPADAIRAWIRAYFRLEQEINLDLGTAQEQRRRAFLLVACPQRQRLEGPSDRGEGASNPDAIIAPRPDVDGSGLNEVYP